MHSGPPPGKYVPQAGLESESRPTVLTRPPLGSPQSEDAPQPGESNLTWTIECEPFWFRDGRSLDTRMYINRGAASQLVRCPPSGTLPCIAGTAAGHHVVFRVLLPSRHPSRTQVAAAEGATIYPRCSRSPSSFVLTSCLRQFALQRDTFVWFRLTLDPIFVLAAIIGSRLTTS